MNIVEALTIPVVTETFRQPPPAQESSAQRGPAIGAYFQGSSEGPRRGFTQDRTDRVEYMPQGVSPRTYMNREQYTQWKGDHIEHMLRTLRVTQNQGRYTASHRGEVRNTLLPEIASTWYCDVSYRAYETSFEVESRCIDNLSGRLDEEIEGVYGMYNPDDPRYETMSPPSATMAYYNSTGNSIGTTTTSTGIWSTLASTANNFQFDESIRISGYGGYAPLMKKKPEPPKPPEQVQLKLFD